MSNLPHVGDGELRTPEEWVKLLTPGRTIIDPDGWRGQNARGFDDEISEQEFRWRFSMCTVGSSAKAMETQALVWRCVTCGKWSHAKRRPLGHERTVILEPASQCVPLCDNCAPFGSCGASSDAIVATVKCGPFAEWEAYRSGVRA